MDKMIVELEKLTKHGLSELAKMDYERVVDFMEQRARIINELLKSNPGIKEKVLYRKRIESVLKHDMDFISKMTELKEEARQQVAKFETSRVQRNAYDYDSAYEVGSLFFDKKK